MNQILLMAQIIVGIILSILILLQQRGGSLGSVFGGSGEFYSTRRGIEKNIYWATIVFGASFIILALLNIFL